MAGGEQQLLGLAGEGQSVFVKLQTSQVLLARCLELQFLDLADYPHTSKHVRLGAHDARTIHGDTVALFQRFSVTAKHIANSLMPMLLDGIELKEPSLVAGAFNEVLSCVTEMSSGADHIHSRYGALVSKIVECGKEIATAEDARKNENKAEINELDEQLREAGRTLDTLPERLVECGIIREELKQRVQIIDQEIKKHKESTPGDTGQHKVLAVADNQSGQHNKSDSQVSGQPLDQTHQAGGEPGEEDFDMVDDDVTEQGVQKSGHETGDPGEESSGFSFSGLTKTIKSAASSMKNKTVEKARGLQSLYQRHFSSDIEGESQQEKITLQEEINKVDEQIHRIRSEEEDLNLQKRQLIDQKALKEAEKPINAEGVCNAKEVVQGVIYHLSEICEFWTTMKQNIQPLAVEEEASNVYRSATGSDSARTFFLEKMSLSLKGWERLDALCMDYVRHFQQDPVEGLGRIFAFLSAPIGQPRGVIEARTSELRKAVTPIA